MIRAVAVAVLLLQVGTLRAQIAVSDDRGQELVLPAPARRIVSLAPHLSELLFAAGAGSTLVGAATFSDYPAGARKVPRVGDSNAIDIERVVALQPDVVLAWRNGTSVRTIARLERLGLPVFVTEPTSLAAIAEQITLLGRIAGTETTAAKAAARLRRETTALRHRYRDRRPVSLFYQVWHAPLMTVNGHQVISEVIRLCGGKNIFAGLGPLVPRVSVEAVLAADPEAIVTASEQPAAQALSDWLQWKNLRAVRNGNLVALPPDEISRPTPRLLEGARRLCARLDGIRRRDATR